jgi:hypothetical protein
MEDRNDNATQPTNASDEKIEFGVRVMFTGAVERDEETGRARFEFAFKPYAKHVEKGLKKLNKDDIPRYVKKSGPCTHNHDDMHNALAEIAQNIMDKSFQSSTKSPLVTPWPPYFKMENQHKDIKAGDIIEVYAPTTDDFDRDRNEDASIGRTQEELDAPYPCYSFTPNGDIPECDLPPIKEKEGRIPAFLYWRYVKDARGSGYVMQTEIFIPSKSIIASRPKWINICRSHDRNSLYRSRPATRIEYEQLEGSKKFGTIKHINARTLQPRFVELLMKHNESPLSDDEFDEMMACHSLGVCDSNFPSKVMCDQ